MIFFPLKPKQKFCVPFLVLVIFPGAKKNEQKFNSKIRNIRNVQSSFETDNTKDKRYLEKLIFFFSCLALKFYYIPSLFIVYVIFKKKLRALLAIICDVLATSYNRLVLKDIQAYTFLAQQQGYLRYRLKIRPYFSSTIKKRKFLLVGNKNGLFSVFKIKS